MQNRRKKWNFPLNFRTMRKLSDLYSGIFQTQSSGCASGVDLFRNFTKLKILNIWIVKYLLNCKRYLSYKFSNIPENFRMLSTREYGCASGMDHFRTWILKFCHGNNICFTELFSNHPEKGGKMSQKQLTSACTRIRIHSEHSWKFQQAHISKSYNLLILFFNKTPPKGMKWWWKRNLASEIMRWGLNEMKHETLHWIKKVQLLLVPPSPCFLFLFFALWK